MTQFGEGPHGPNPILLEAMRRLEQQGIAPTEQRLFEAVQGRGASRTQVHAFMEKVRKGRPQRSSGPDESAGKLAILWDGIITLASTQTPITVENLWYLCGFFACVTREDVEEYLQKSR